MSKAITWFALLGLTLLELISPTEAHAVLDQEGFADANLRSKGLIMVKVGALLIVFALAMFGSLFPYHYRKRVPFLLLGTQFAGGVFLATALLHFLADSDAAFKVLVPDTKYSLSALFAVTGYLLTMLADWMVHRVHNHLVFQRLDLENAAEEGRVAGPEADMKVAILATLNVFDAVLLFLTLCFHSVFDGMTIGLVGTKDDVWSTMWMVGSHKFVLAIAMSIVVLRLASSKQLLNSLIYGFAFSVSTSIGVAIGILINSTAEGKTADWIFAVWMGIGTGVFIYVVIHHLLAKPESCKLPYKEQLFMWLAMFIGALVAGIVLFWD